MLGLFFGTVLAHLESGEDITKDGYIIDFGFSPKIVQENQPSNFVINIVNSTNEQPINITSTWIRISLKDKIAFAGEFFSKQGGVSFTYTFPKTGNYTIDTKFYQNDLVIEEQAFSIKVENQTNYYFIIAGIIFIVVLFFIAKRTKK